MSRHPEPGDVPVDDAIEDGVSHGRIAELFMPAIDRQLTRDDRGPGPVAIVEDLEEVLALRVFQSHDAPVVEDEHPTRAKRASRAG